MAHTAITAHFILRPHLIFCVNLFFILCSRSWSFYILWKPSLQPWTDPRHLEEVWRLNNNRMVMCFHWFSFALFQAMYLVYRALEGEPVPMSLPPPLVPPSKRKKPSVPPVMPLLPSPPSVKDSRSSHAGSKTTPHPPKPTPAPAPTPAAAPVSTWPACCTWELLWMLFFFSVKYL